MRNPAAILPLPRGGAGRGEGVRLQEPAWVRRGLIITALAFVTLFLVLPLVTVFARAFEFQPLQPLTYELFPLRHTRCR